MKNTTIYTPTHEIMLVEMPDMKTGAPSFADRHQFQDALKEYPINLGLVPKLTEEMCEPLVEESKTLSFENEDIKIYRDYLRRNYMCSTDTALESFLSALETKVFWSNPFGDMPEIREYVFEYHYELETQIHEYDINSFHKDLDEWMEAQSRTFDKARTLVLVKENK